MSFCRRNPSAGFPASRASAPGVSRAPSKGQVWRGFRDILIPARRVRLRSFRAVPTRRPNTRISGSENEQIVNAHPKVSFFQWKNVRRGVAPKSGYVPFQGAHCHYCGFWAVCGIKNKVVPYFFTSQRYFCLTNIARHDLRGPVENQAFPCLSAHLSLYLRHTL